MQKVRCNWCEKIFPESEILYNEATGKESCPYCHESGFLMDLNYLTGYKTSLTQKENTL